jgi:hypothetical protein
MYLLIENQGVAPVESYTLLGASTSRDSKTEGVIGQFGTGAKQSTNLLLRHGLEVRIYCGTTKIEFFTELHTITDEFGSKEVSKVYATVGRKRVDLGWTLDFGALDWNDVGMALREFVSNALDRTTKAGLEPVAARECGELTITLTDTPRAKAGTTRVYVQASTEVQEYFAKLPTRFLQLSDDPLRTTKVQPKAGRGEGAVIYREGVFVCELPGKSLYDYNFSRHELAIDECRNLNVYVVRARIAEMLKNASATMLYKVFKAVYNNEAVEEANIDGYYLKLQSWDGQTRRESVNNEWRTAWAMFAGQGVLCSDEKQLTMLDRKGFKGVHITNSVWFNAMKVNGVPEIDQKLTKHEKEGRETLPATYAADRAVKIVWEWIEMANMTNGKDRPEVVCFVEPAGTSPRCLGYYQPGTDEVAINIEVEGAELLTVALEECAHYASGANDCTREFQEFFMRMIVRCYLAGGKSFCGVPYAAAR